MPTLRRPYHTNPHTTPLLELARLLADELEDENTHQPPPHVAVTIAELCRVRWAEKNWRPTA